MEAVRDFVSFAEAGQEAQPVLGRALGLLRRWPDGGGGRGVFGFPAASDFAGEVEELSRTVEYLQLVAAGAVDRAGNRRRRRPARPAPRGPPGGGTAPRRRPGTAAPMAAAACSSAGSRALTLPRRPSVPRRLTARCRRWSGTAVAGASAVVDDGYRNTAEFLRARLRISAAEASRRLALAGSVLPRQGLAGRPLPPVRAGTRRGPRRRGGRLPGRDHHRRWPWTGSGTSATPGGRGGDGTRPDPHRRRERPGLPGPGRPALDRRPGPGRRRTLRGAPAPAPGRLPPPAPPRPAPPGNLRDHRAVRTPPHRHEHRHQPPHPARRRPDATGGHRRGRHRRRIGRGAGAPRRRPRTRCRCWTCAPGRRNSSTASSAPAR